MPGDSQSCKTPYDICAHTPSYTLKRAFGCGNVYLTVNARNNKPFRVFIKVGKVGGCERALLEAIGRLATNLLQLEGRGLEDAAALVQHTLVGIRCGKGLPVAGGLSCMDALARELDRFIKDPDGVPV